MVVPFPQFDNEKNARDLFLDEGLAAQIVYADYFEASAPSGDATATGVTLTEALSFVPGSATGQSNATASGATVSAVYSLLPGAASAGVAATASGATVSAVYSFAPGTAVGEAVQRQDIGVIDGLKRKPDSRNKKLEELVEAAFERVTAPGDAPTQEDVKVVVRSVRQEIKLDGIEAAISEIRSIVNQYAAYLKKKAEEDEEEILAFMMMG